MNISLNMIKISKRSSSLYNRRDRTRCVDHVGRICNKFRSPYYYRYINVELCRYICIGGVFEYETGNASLIWMFDCVVWSRYLESRCVCS